MTAAGETSVTDPMRVPWIVAHLPPPPAHAIAPDAIEPALARIASRYCLLSEAHDDIYDFGTTSFVQATLWRDDDGFRVPSRDTGSKTHRCLMVMVSKLAPYAVIAESQRWRNPSGHAVMLPGFDKVDAFTRPATRELAEMIGAEFETLGMIRLSGTQVAIPLLDGLAFPTNLNNGPQRLFDALFHWFD